MTATITAAEIQANDHIVWRTPNDGGQTAHVVSVQDSADFPGYVEITASPLRGWQQGGRITRRFPKERFVAERL
jgi:hypothetical protein